MSFNPLAGATVAGLLDYLPENPSVVELGNQSFAVSDEVLDSVIEKLRRLKRKVDVNALKAFYGKADSSRSPLTEAYYRALGFSSYTAIDVNQKYGSVPMDLNKDLRRDYGFTKTYDLVTNNGTGEHLFNQYAVFKNVHDLTNVGGVMLHIMPCVNWVNHCFYNFHPILYADLAVANGYELKKLSLASRWAFEIDISLPQEEKSVAIASANNSLGRSVTPKSGGKSLRKSVRKVWRKATGRRPSFSQINLADSLQEIVLLGRDSWLALALQKVMEYEEAHTKRDFPNVMIVAALQKKTDAPFAIPMQGKYVDDIEAKAISQTYQSQASLLGSNA
jgi:hypothetical protein